MPEKPINILAILDAFPFYVMLVDEDHYILEANRTVYHHLGVKREDVLGQYCPKVVHSLDKPFPGCPLEAAAQSGKALERELQDPQTGRWVVSAIYPTRILTAKKKKVFLHMVTDVTERKQAQEQLKISHAQLRTLSAHLESVREDEKRQIARDLHDDTSQLLSSLYVHLEAAIGALPEGAQKSEVLLRKAQTLSTTILDEIHKLIYELRPVNLDKLGLVPSVSSLLETSFPETGVKVSLRTTGKVIRLMPPVEIALFRVIQEALNNILKHAQAHQAKIVLNFGRESLKISITDDGVGFDVQDVVISGTKPRGLGLLGMRERLELIGGSIDIKSTPGSGTAITVLVPLKGSASYG